MCLSDSSAVQQLKKKKGRKKLADEEKARPECEVKKAELERKKSQRRKRRKE